MRFGAEVDAEFDDVVEDGVGEAEVPEDEAD